MTNKVRWAKGGGRRVAVTSLACLALAAADAASAGSFRVSPVNIVLPPDRATTSLTIKNNDQEPIAVRLLAYKWTQEQGMDVHSPTNEIIASPPIFTILVGATQIVRLGLRTRAAGTAYRVILEEIPRSKPKNAGIQVLLRLDLPMYVEAVGGKADVRWIAFRGTGGDLVLEARNEGSLRAQVLELAALDPAGRKVILSKERGVILPHSARQWKIGRIPQFSGAPRLLYVRSASGETQANVVAQNR